MNKLFSRIGIAATAAAALAGTIVFADAAQRYNQGSGTEIMSPGGTFLGSATLWAAVNANGTVAKSDGHRSVVKLSSAGNYRVLFHRNIRNCAYVATIGLGGSVGVSAPGFVTVAGDVLDVTGVYIQTFSSAGVLADRGFHLLVTC